ncbi:MULTISPECIES: hypothetical protein [Oscillatoriales]|uniref:hypothetical protein n=1 Tax=Oscillatoriales TaxID=1150 RepID=UPI0001D0EE07|nr:hypothetical protein AP285_19675 [Arthrospira platensis YZ]KDR54196.1 hypothetical protein APPUASWS_029385 [Arthrospira platensis str. Paraca]BAI92295.1 hypothetical protein NIES39_L01340 [Arthrospira platensis NIES-39]
MNGRVDGFNLIGNYSNFWIIVGVNQNTLTIGNPIYIELWGLIWAGISGINMLQYTSSKIYKVTENITPVID